MVPGDIGGGESQSMWETFDPKQSFGDTRPIFVFNLARPEQSADVLSLLVVPWVPALGREPNNVWLSPQERIASLHSSFLRSAASTHVLFVCHEEVRESGIHPPQSNGHDWICVSLQPLSYEDRHLRLSVEATITSSKRNYSPSENL